MGTEVDQSIRLLSCINHGSPNPQIQSWVRRVIAFLKERLRSLVASLDHVMGITGKDKANQTGSVKLKPNSVVR
jgi:hypothetical protein